LSGTGGLLCDLTHSSSFISLFKYCSFVTVVDSIQQLHRTHSSLYHLRPV